MRSIKNKLPRTALSALLTLCLLLSMTVPALAAKAVAEDILVQCSDAGAVTDHTPVTGVNLPVVFDDNADYYPISVDAAVFSGGASVKELTGLAPDENGDLEIGLGAVTNYDYDTVYEIKYRSHYVVLGEGTEIVEEWKSAGLYFKVETAPDATEVTLTTAAADGADGTVTSTKINLTFSAAITGLTADNITITDGTGAAVKGALSGSGTSWSIALTSVTAQGDVSVAVASPPGYSISGSPKTVAVYKAMTPPDTYTATVTVNKDGSAWSSGAPSITIGADTDSDLPNGSAFVNGTYNIYADGTDTGVDITVSGTTATAALNYYTLTLTAGTGINSVSGDGVYLSGASVNIDAVVSGGYAWEKWSDNNTTKSRTITVTAATALTASAVSSASTVTSVTVSPLTITVQKGNRQQFSATVSGTNSPAQTVIWSVNGGGAGTFIDDDGLLTLAADESASTLTVTATSTADTLKSGSATVTITDVPPSAYTATVTVNKDGAVWSTGAPNITIGTTRSGALANGSAFGNGIYHIYADVTDTGIDITVSGAAATATLNYYTLTLTAGTGITSISGNGVYLDGDEADIDAVVLNGCTWEKWSDNNTAKARTITVSSTLSLTATATVIPPATTYTVTFHNNGSAYVTKTVNAGQSIGSANFPADPARSGYTFGGWFTGENGTGTQFTYTTSVNATTTVYAKWMYSGGGDGGGASTAPPKPAYNADVKTGDGSQTTLPVTVNKAYRSASINMAGQKLTASGAVVTLPSIPDVYTYSVGIPVPELSTTDAEGALTLHTDHGSITIPSNMLTDEIGGTKAEITLGQGDKTGLPEEIKAAIGDRPLIQLTLAIDGAQTDWANPNAPVTVSIPYKPTAAELANPESIVIWYIDGSGKAVAVPNGRYDPAAGAVIFETTHFSDFAVGYNPVRFEDVASDAWYSNAVSFIAARGITTGTGNGNYGSEARLTRGEFLVLMMRAYDIAPDANGLSVTAAESADNFADAGNTYYTGYLAAAKRLGISAGTGSNLYAPDKEISRQEMFTLLYNGLKVIGQLPQGSSGTTVGSFTDAEQISVWAKNAMTLLVATGTVGGSGGKLAPRSTTTRAEMAQVLYNLLVK